MKSCEECEIVLKSAAKLEKRATAGVAVENMVVPKKERKSQSWKETKYL